jgi:hypothetical protein
MKLKKPEKFRNATEVLGFKCEPYNDYIDVPDKYAHRLKKLGFKEVEVEETSPVKHKYHCKYCNKGFNNKGRLLQHYRHCDKRD